MFHLNIRNCNNCIITCNIYTCIRQRSFISVFRFPISSSRVRLQIVLLLWNVVVSYFRVFIFFGGVFLLVLELVVLAVEQILLMSFQITIKTFQIKYYLLGFASTSPIKTDIQKSTNKSICFGKIVWPKMGRFW